MNTLGDSTSPKLALPVRLAALVGLVESVGLLIYSAALGIASLNSSGATESAPIVLIITFLVFFVCVALVTRGLCKGSQGATTPFLVIQIFVVIVGYTVFVGDGTVVKAMGGSIGLLGLVGLGVGIASMSR